MNQENSNNNKTSKTSVQGQGVFCFGELLLRLSPALHRKWIKNANLTVYIAGAELNVASALAKWDVPVKYCTTLPDNYLTKEICEEIKRKNVDIFPVLFFGERLGVYYLPEGTDLKTAGVIYDRAHSSFSELKPGMIRWEELFKNSSWFHFSAINPALNENIAAVCKEALEAAATMGLTISIDLNYRAKLWKYGKQPSEVMPELLNYCDVVMGNIWSENSLLGIPVDEAIHDKKSKEAYLAHASRSAREIMKRYPQCKTVANTFRFTEDDSVLYYAAMNTGDDQYISKEFSTNHVRDKVGSGDCFMAGLIYGLYHRHSPQQVIDFATAAAFGKLNEKGDATNQTVEDINGLLKVGAGGET